MIYNWQPETRSQTLKDADYVGQLLPDHYTVQPDPGSLRCRSTTGIGQGLDDEDDEHWGYVMEALRLYFGERLLEVDHSTNYKHTDFTIHLRTS